MFTATSGHFARTGAAFAGAYRQTSLHTGVGAASPHRLVAMLFEGIIEDLALAKGAIAGGERELKARALARAVRIVDEGLRGCLDLKAGGRMAADLHELYAYITRRLMHANLRDDVAALDECRRLIEPLRDAWQSIAPQAATQAQA
jgi:flagellar protein FliS